MKKKFHQFHWDDILEADWRALLRMAIDEDLGRAGDLTTCSLVPRDAMGRASISARQSGVVAGLSGVKTALDAVDQNLAWSPEASDGQAVEQGARIGVISGPAQGLFAVERLLLNFLGRLSGIATLTRKYVELAAGTRARIFDTRKTTPGWRRLEKYAVRCGGGWNHRSGLFEAVLIKDNHLAWGADSHRESSALHPGRSGVAGAALYCRTCGEYRSFRYYRRSGSRYPGTTRPGFAQPERILCCSIICQSSNSARQPRAAIKSIRMWNSKPREALRFPRSGKLPKAESSGSASGR